MEKRAIVIGATGLVGSNLVQLLLKDEHYSRVTVFVRRSTNIAHDRLTEHVVDFAQVNKWSHLIEGDVLFSAMGTTLAKAGGKEKQYEIDYTYQYNVAAAASRNGVGQYVLVSSMNANASSSFFYMKMKGQLEMAVEELAFGSIIIIQPGLLYGDRDGEKRLMEDVSIKLMKGLGNLGVLRSRRPIHGAEVAQAMLQAAKGDDALVVRYGGAELFELAEEYIG